MTSSQSDGRPLAPAIEWVFAASGGSERAAQQDNGGIAGPGAVEVDTGGLVRKVAAAHGSRLLPAARRAAPVNAPVAVV